MPVFFGWLATCLLSTVGELAVRALIGLGVGIAVHQAMNSDLVRSTLTSYLQASGPLWGYVGALGIDTAMTIVLSAWAGRIAANAAKAFVVKRPS